MKIVFWGTPQFAVPSLRCLLESPDFDVVGVVTQPDRRRGRGKQLSSSPVKAVALDAEISVWQPERIKKDRGTLNTLNELNADAFVVVAYGQILSTEILKMPRLGCINSHGSLLPRYRGAAPIQWALVNGETETGITTMLMDKGMDTGDMLLKSHYSIGLLENAHDVAIALSEQSGPLLMQTLTQLDQGLLFPQAQDHDVATYAPLIHKPDYGLDWSKSAIALHNQIRGFFPSCVATFREQPLKIMETVPLCESCQDHLPKEYQAIGTEILAVDTSKATLGEVVKIAKSQGPVIKTGEGCLLLRLVQLSGKRKQSGWDFANGLRIFEGEVLYNGEPA